MNDKNLVIDLDETLLHTYSDRGLFENFEPKYGERKFELDHCYGVLRPNVASFLGWCAGTFKHIGVWSAGQKDYVNDIVDLLFTGRKPTFVWCWEDCDAYVNDYGTMIYHKPLEFVFDTYPQFTPRDTIFIDDALHSELCNAGNMITITPFNPELMPQEPDSSLLDLKKFLKTFKKTNDVRTIDKKII